MIVGSDSLIGGALMSELKRTGRQVIGTTRRRETVDTDHFYLDLLKDPGTWNCPDFVTVAFVCASVTRIESCRRDPVESARVNVKGIFELVRNLTEKGIFVIYLSTNQVFDGTVPHRLPDDQLSPITEYGKQKAEAERLISRFDPLVAIVRFSKILEPRNPLFCEWQRLLRKGKVIHPFFDMVMAPVGLACAVSILSIMGEHCLPGIFQVSGNEDVSYAEVAHIGATICGVDERLVQPVLSSRSGCYLEKVVEHTTMDVTRLKLVFGVEIPDVRTTIKTIFTELLAFEERSVSLKKGEY
ncbi:MAG: sugar nucleotide-binding protein [Candidatus Omnitrophota bacterium]